MDVSWAGPDRGVTSWISPPPKKILGLQITTKLALTIQAEKIYINKLQSNETFGAALWKEGELKQASSSLRTNACGNLSTGAAGTKAIEKCSLPYIKPSFPP
jgi:hypothetical protein